MEQLFQLINLHTKQKEGEAFWNCHISLVCPHIGESVFQVGNKQMHKYESFWPGRTAGPAKPQLFPRERLRVAKWPPGINWPYCCYMIHLKKSRISNWLPLGKLELYLFLPVENFPSHFGEFSNGAAMPFNRHKELGMDIPHFSRGSFSHYPNAPCHRLNDFSKTVLKYNTHKNTYTTTNKNTNTNTIPSTTASIFQWFLFKWAKICSV